MDLGPQEFLAMLHFLLVAPRCSACHAVVELTSDGLPPRFCFDCGTELKLTKRDFGIVETSLKVCPRCKKSIKPRADGRVAKFCDTCGHRFPASEPCNNETFGGRCMYKFV